MKFIVFSIFFSLSAIACPDLQGNYLKCSQELMPGLKSIIISQNELHDNLTEFHINFITNTESPNIVITDGQEREFDDGYMAFTCTETELIGVVDVLGEETKQIFSKKDGKLVLAMEFLGEIENIAVCEE